MTRRLPLMWQVIHWIIIGNFLLQVLYGAYMVFVGMAPPGHIGPLGSAASALPPDKMMARRLYASETWIAISGLCVYLAITEILPRQLRLLRDHEE